MSNNITFVVSSMIERNGLERVVATLANYFSSKDYIVTIITRDSVGTEYGFFIDKNVKRVFLPGNVLKFIKAVKKHVLENKPSYLISNNMGKLTLALACIDFKKLNCEFISYEHVAAISSPKWVQLLKRIQYKNVWKVVVLSSQDLNEYKKFHRNVFKVGNPIPFDIPEKKEYDCKNKKIISLGRLTYQKGYDLLLRAWVLIEKKYPEWSFYIYGKGEDYEKLVALKEELEIKNVYFEGPSTNVEKVYEDASFYVMSSRFEGLPMVLIEAQAFSLPIVSFNCPHGPSDILNSNNGVLVDNGNVVQLSKSIAYLIENEKIRYNMSIVAFENAQKYSIDNIFNSWQEILK